MVACCGIKTLVDDVYVDVKIHLKNLKLFYMKLFMKILLMKKI